MKTINSTEKLFQALFVEHTVIIIPVFASQLKHIVNYGVYYE